MRRIFHLLAAIAVSATVGCGVLDPKVITEEFEGRNCGIFAIEGDWLVYSWSPPTERSRPVHLVVRNLAAGTEHELEPDWYGTGLDITGDILVYEKRGKGDPETQLLALNLKTEESVTLAWGKVGNPVASGQTAAWEVRDDLGRSTITIGPINGNYSSGVVEPGRPEHATDTQPRLEGDHLIFLRQNLSDRSFSIMHQEVSTAAIEILPIEIAGRVVLDVAGDSVVFARAPEQAIYRMDLATKIEERIADAPRWSGGPVGHGSKVAWTTHMAKEDFKGIAGQPLIDERDFRSLHVLDLRSGRTKTVVSDRFMVYRIAVNSDGEVFANLRRGVVAGPDMLTDIARF